MDDFRTRMITVTLPFFSYLLQGSSGSKSKVDCIAISKVWTTEMLVAGEGPPDKHTGAPVVQALEQFSRMQSEREQTLGFAAMTLNSACRLCRVSTFAT